MAKILIIEDEVDLVDLYLTTLQDAGHDVHTAPNWKQAHELILAAQDPRFDIALADFMLPDKNSIAAFDELLSLGLAIPKVIIMTGASMQEIKSYQVGFSFLVLEKPFSKSALLESIRQLLSGVSEQVCE